MTPEEQITTNITMVYSCI